ncbi:MAG: hypothetical protein IJX91_04615 [Clostridia bacterium]|nr:hypothetical protein [Clostridia bacterium]
MKIYLPVVTKNEYDNKSKTHLFETQERSFEFDCSLGCQMKWEAKFPAQAEKESIVDYVKRVSEYPHSAATLLSKMKAVYCFINGENLSFESFVRMFDFTRREYVETLTERFKEIFDLFESEAAEKN